MAADIVPIRLGLTKGDLYTLWAPRWRDAGDEWEAFLGKDEDLYAFESVADLVAFVRTNTDNDLTDHPAWEKLTEANAHTVRSRRRSPVRPRQPRGAGRREAQRGDRQGPAPDAGDRVDHRIGVRDARGHQVLQRQPGTRDRSAAASTRSPGGPAASAGPRSRR